MEGVPTPEENIVLLPYSWKRGIFNGFRPCNLAAFRFPQKPGDLLVVRKTRGQPEPAMTENKRGSPEGGKCDLFLEKNERIFDGNERRTIVGAFVPGETVVGCSSSSVFFLSVTLL